MPATFGEDPLLLGRGCHGSTLRYVAGSGPHFVTSGGCLSRTQVSKDLKHPKSVVARQLGCCPCMIEQFDNAIGKLAVCDQHDAAVLQHRNESRGHDRRPDLDDRGGLWIDLFGIVMGQLQVSP